MSSSEFVNPLRYYFEGIEKAGLPRFKYVNSQNENGKSKMVAAARVPLQVGIVLDGFIISILSDFDIFKDIQLTPDKIRITIPSRAYKKQNDTVYDDYLKFDSMDIKMMFIADLKNHFIKFWNHTKNEYISLISTKKTQPQQTDSQTNNIQQSQPPIEEEYYPPIEESRESQTNEHVEQPRQESIEEKVPENKEVEEPKTGQPKQESKESPLSNFRPNIPTSGDDDLPF